MDRVFSTTHTVESALDSFIEYHRNLHQLHHQVSDRWAIAPATDIFTFHQPLASSATNSGWVDVACETPTGFAHLCLHPDSTLRVTAYGATRDEALAVLADAAVTFPIGVNPAENVVPVRFWTYSPQGARQTNRDIDANTWAEIAENYPTETRVEIEKMMSPKFRPGVGGQLVLWHGEPGTGKTTCLRALAREWRKWAAMHYVVDPERFFGSHADYMMDVLMNDGATFVDSEDSPEGKRPQWRVLVLEDCGEMLGVTAKTDVGQALSRFLNACDGLIGRGLRVLILVTTNEPLAKQHPAVSRPGRCAARVEFETFTHAEAREWLENHGNDDPAAAPQHLTLADLYARIGGFEHEHPVPVGFG